MVIDTDPCNIIYTIVSGVTDYIASPLLRTGSGAPKYIL